MGTFQLIVQPRRRPPRVGRASRVVAPLGRRLAELTRQGVGGLRSTLVPWLLLGRTGQWVTVVAVVAATLALAGNIPAWPLGIPTSAFAAFVVAGGVVAAASRSLRATPLGDATDLVIDAVPALRQLPYATRRPVGLGLFVAVGYVLLALLDPRGPSL